MEYVRSHKDYLHDQQTSITCTEAPRFHVMLPISRHVSIANRDSDDV